MAKKDLTKPKHKGVFRETRLFFRRLKGHWGILLLLIISLSLAYLNYKPGTFLIGWDSLHPELNPALDLKRGLFSVWQEYRGTGVLAGMSHAADLPRTLLVYLLVSLNIPLNLIRYLTTFVHLILGPLGVYFFIHHQILGKKQDTKTTETASFLGGLFYLLNLGTVQTFFTPFETFTWFYGSFPWLIYFLTSYLSKPNIGGLITLALVSLFAAPAFYVETIFVVFIISIIPFLLEVWGHHKLSIKKLLQSLNSLISITVPQLFWLLPIIFFVFTNSHITTNNHINAVSSPETYERNLEFANLPDFFQLKGFWFKYLDLGMDNKYEFMLSTWISHLQNPAIYTLGILFVILILSGIYFLLKEKLNWSRSLFCSFFLSAFFLLGGGQLINSIFPLLGELFRSPFTKFSIPLMFHFSIFFAIGTVFLLDLFTFLHSQLTYNLTIFTVFFALFVYMSPAFSGNLVSPKMRVAIPQEYFDLFNYMSTQDPNTRIANLPQHTFWGWQYYQWGYRGSGFIWYGLKQPILDRAFDVWEKTSEKYYEELSTAIYSKNQRGFENTLDKYAVNWLLIDHNIISPASKSDLGLETIYQFLDNNPKITLEKSFNDTVFLYKVKLSNPHQNFLGIGSDDGDTSSPIFNLSLRPNSNFLFRDKFISLISSTSTSQNQQLSIPSLTETENLIPIKIEYQKTPNALNFKLTPITPTIFVDDTQYDLESKPTFASFPYSNFSQEFILEINHHHLPFEIPAELDASGNYYPLSEIYLPTKNKFDLSLFSGANEDYQPLTDILSQADPYQCYTNKRNRKVEKIVTPNSITLLGTDVVGCLSTRIPDISPDRLLGVTFSYFSPTLTSANINLTDDKLSATNTTQPQKPQKEPKLTRLFFSPSDKHKQINLLLEAEDTKSVQEVTYQNLYLTVHAPIGSTSLKLSRIPDLKIPLTSKNQKVQVSLPLTTTPFDQVETVKSNSLFPEGRNCDQFNNGDVVKKVDDDTILYQSRNATQCDYLNLRHLNHSLNYLITVDAKNQKGLPLTTCLENYTTRRCDIFERLSDSTTPQSIIQPISNTDEAPGYTLHLFNQSFGNRITSNTLTSLSVHPIPLTFLKEILINQQSTTTPDLPTSPLNTSHPYEYFYQITNTPKTGNLNLYQTHSPYWIALNLPDSYKNLTPAQTTFKLIFDHKNLDKLPQTSSNQWFNQWKLTSENPQTISVVYIPQYLQFIGHVLSFIFFATTIFIYFLKIQRP